MSQFQPSDESETTYSIGAVADLTGLSVHTIRIWERRYGAVVAHRSPNGRRVYAPADVEKLRLLKELTDRSLPISSIASLSLEGLRERTADLEKLRAFKDGVVGTLTDMPTDPDARRAPARNVAAVRA